MLAAILGLGLAIGALSIASARLGPSVDSVTTLQSLDGTSVNTPIAITFTVPMNKKSVERALRISPSVAGDVSWSGNQLYFAPRHALAYSTLYTVSVDTSGRDTTGKHLSHAYHTSFTTQSHHLLYLGSQGSERGRLMLASVSGAQRAVGIDDGLITDFSVSLDRSLAVYVKHGASGERSDEIWLLSLTDNSTQRLFRRPDWTISGAHFSPDLKSVVFLASNVRLCQQYYGCYRAKSQPIIFLLDLHSTKVHQFKSNGDAPITNFIDFSPAGQVAYTDLGSALTLADPNGSRVIHVPNQGNSLEFAGFDVPGDKAAFVGQTPSSSGGDILVYSRSKYLDVSKGVYDSSTPAFSTSGKQIAYAAYRTELGIEPVYGVNVYDFRTGKTMRLTSERRWSDWSPAWSSDDRYIAYVRSQPQEAMYMGAGKIWIMRSDGTGGRSLGGVGSGPFWIS